MRDTFIANMTMISYGLIAIQIFLEPLFYTYVQNDLIEEMWFTFTGIMLIYFGITSAIRLRKNAKDKRKK